MLAQILVSGVTAGAVYALVALGFVVLHRGTRVVHFGLGDQLTLSAYIVVIGQVFLGLPFAAAILLSLLLSAGFGVLIERGVMRPLRGSPLLVMIIATLAIGAAVREGLRASMGPLPWPVPFLLSPAPFTLGGLVLVPANLAVVGVALAVMLALFAMLRWTRFGRAIVAVYENPTGAAIVGISVPGVHARLWGLSSVLAAVAGILMAPLITLSPDMGTIGIKGFAAAILGGFNSLPGAIAGGFLLGIVETGAGVYVSTAMKDIVSYALLIGCVLLLPRGLFGTAEARKV
ncbi:branched-chain amino acid ABC transporter permease [Caldovatus sediminis]|uniref:Branched-chain amino acid ABC transporter permease n=1 Tax=Caldovatus sediminis TaxID=2041189 RepID=A0A8J2Z8P9_9PROT|nr:branched-chain amino acid ABC transporter permease [Caldovatus sediminis]GGG21614.1 branched-chain amino acid ABC transporter permease [Caldovatus sediminis]